MSAIMLAAKPAPHAVSLGIRRRFGWRPSGVARTYASFKTATPAKIPAAYSLERFAPPVFDQGQIGSCGGHGTACGIYTAFASAGTPLTWVPSPCGIYKLARCQDRLAAPNGTLAPLQDSGILPTDLSVVLNKWGIEPMGPEVQDPEDPALRWSDCSQANVNTEPNFNELGTCSTTLVVGQSSITGTGKQLLQNIAAAIFAGFPVMCGTPCGDNFEMYAAGPPIAAENLASPDTGGHWVCIIGYRTDNQGNIILRYRNSWGESWGLGGDYEASPALVQQGDDFTVLHISRKGS